MPLGLLPKDMLVITVLEFASITVTEFPYSLLTKIRFEAALPSLKLSAMKSKSKFLNIFFLVVLFIAIDGTKAI